MKHDLIFEMIFVLKDYQKKHPEVAVIDPPDAIERLHNRQSMLEDVAELNLCDCKGNWISCTVCVRIF